MSTQERPPFQLVAGHIVLDLVNTLDNRFAPGGPEELLVDFKDVLRFYLQSGLLAEEQGTEIAKALNTREQREGMLLEVRRVRETLARILYKIVDERDAGSVPGEGGGPDTADIDEISMLLWISAPMKRLSWADGRMRWNWNGEKAGLPVYKLLESAEELLTSEQLWRVKKCASPVCQWLILDSGKKNHVRRWCDMKVCGNRMKARRHQSRVRGAGDPGVGSEKG